jgi:hypothetical protein
MIIIPAKASFKPSGQVLVYCDITGEETGFHKTKYHIIATDDMIYSVDYAEKIKPHIRLARQLLLVQPASVN